LIDKLNRQIRALGTPDGPLHEFGPQPPRPPAAPPPAADPPPLPRNATPNEPVDQPIPLGAAIAIGAADEAPAAPPADPPAALSPPATPQALSSDDVGSPDASLAMNVGGIASGAIGVSEAEQQRRISESLDLYLQYGKDKKNWPKEARAKWFQIWGLRNPDVLILTGENTYR
jgi:hypothetical protein